MSKPTEEIIELSKKLYELGHRQGVEQGGWYLYQKRMKIPGLFTADMEHSQDEETIPIPSLEDGLDWLWEKGYSYDLRPRFQGCLLTITEWETDEATEIYADTLREVALKAMVQVLENQ